MPTSILAHTISTCTTSVARAIWSTFWRRQGSARAVELYDGFAYVADNRAGLQVVNYLATDTDGVAPTVTLSTNFPAGLAEEGQLLRLSAEISDDNQVSRVEFYVDGALAVRDGNFPFEHRLITPLATLQPTMTVEARAFDTGGNNTWSGSQELTLVADATAPQVFRHIAR